MTEWILELVYMFKRLSYGGLVLALSIEFVPAEIVLPLAGYWVHLGDMKLLPAIVAGTIGGTLGPMTLYLLGRYGGRPVIEKYGKYFFMKPQHLEASDRFFEKYGNGVAFYGRFVPGVRTLISIPCGMSRMNPFTFAAFTFMAMLPITSVYVYVGYKLGSQWEQVGEIIKPYAGPVALFVILCFGCYVYFKRPKPTISQ